MNRNAQCEYLQEKFTMLQQERLHAYLPESQSNFIRISSSENQPQLTGERRQIPLEEIMHTLVLQKMQSVL